MPHERAFRRPKADRVALLRATRTNTSAVFAMYADTRGEITGAISRRVEGMRPLAEATVGDEVHRVWAIGDRLAMGELREAFAKRRLYIADGHHRYETALTYLGERDGTADAPQRFILAYLCALDDAGLRILATHRIVRDSGDALDRAIDRSFERAPIDAGALGDTQPGIVIVRDGHFTRLQLREGADGPALPSAWRELPGAQAEELLRGDAGDAR